MLGKLDELIPRRLDSPLGIHSKLHDVQKHLQHGLDLGVATGCAEGHEQLAVLERQGGIGCESRPFPRLNAGRMVGVEPALHTPGGEDNAHSRNDRPPQGGVARGSREGVAPAVHNARVAGVALLRTGERRQPLGRRLLARPALVRPWVSRRGASPRRPSSCRRLAASRGRIPWTVAL